MKESKIKKPIDIEKFQAEIVRRLLPLDPDKIILFGSYANGMPTEDSDIDLFLIKNVTKENVRKISLEASRKLWDLVFKNKIGFDLFVDSSDRIDYRINVIKDQFYQDVFKNGKIIYVK